MILRLAWAVLLCAAPAFATAPLGQQNARDERLEQKVQEALAASGFGDDAVQARVRLGVVYLTGTVQHAGEKLRAIRAAFAVSEVDALESKIGVLRGITPELEEEIWQALVLEGLERAVSEVLVQDGVAVVRGEVKDAGTRDRVARVAGSVSGIRSVRDEMVVAGVKATTTPVVPEPDVPEPDVPEPDVPEPDVPEPVVPEPVVPEPVAPEPVAPEPVAPEADVPEPDVPEPVAPEPDVPEPVVPEPVVPEPVVPSESDGETARVESWSSSSPASATLSHQIAYAVLTYSRYTVFDHVQFSLEDGAVVLLGAVTEVSKKRELEERIRAIPEVSGIKNELRVLSASKADERLRDKLFRRIYEDPLFAEFADDLHPPIHILVEGGLVTLTGVVDETIQKMSAEALVRNVFEVTLVRNRIRVRER